jgi:Protein of unknown function (DUF2946)
VKFRRSALRQFRVWRPEAWLAMVLLLFTSSQNVVMAIGMLNGSSVHCSGSSHGHEHAVRFEKSDQSEKSPAHANCPWCMAPTFAVITDVSQLGITRLEQLEAMLSFGVRYDRDRFNRFVLARAPPVI